MVTFLGKRFGLGKAFGPAGPVRLWRDRRGVAALEFALIAPALFLLTVGIIDVGRMMWTAATLDHAAREGARYATVRGAQSVQPTSDAEVQAFVVDRAIGVDPANMSVSVVWSPDSNPGGTVTITVGYQYDSLLVGFITRDPINFQSVSSLSIL
ncbi:MAG: pilus assembly protein [Proteobacteria bacterium]|nr:pilus assembly protein [Pseudomonadota bacterium]